MLMGQTFGTREICDVVFKARTEVKIGKQVFKPGQPVLYIDTAKTSTLEGAASTVYAQGGKGNPRLVAWEGERTVTFTVEDALISPLSFAMLTGAGIMTAGEKEDERIYVHTTFDLPILDGGVVKIDLDTAGANHDILMDADTPIFGMILDDMGSGVVPCQCVEATGPEENKGIYTITRQNALVLKFSEAAKYVGQTLRVDCYAMKTSGATEMTIDAKNFAGSYYVEASTLWRDQNGEDYPMELVIPNVKIQSNFTFSMAATGDPSTFTFTMDSFPAYTKFNKKKKIFVAMQLIGEDSLVPDDPEAEEETTEKPLAVELTEVVAGVKGWTDQEFPGDPKHVKFSALGNNLSATIDRANVDFFGNLKRVEGWEAFSDKPADLTGYYYPFTMVSDDAVKFINTTQDGTVKTSNFEDGKIEMIMAVNPDKPVMTVEFENADGEKQEYSFDFSKVRCN